MTSGSPPLPRIPESSPNDPGILRAHPRYGERVVIGALFCCAALSVAVTVGIVLSLIPPTLEFFTEVDIFAFLTGTDWAPLFVPAKFGVLPIVMGTIVVTICAISVAVPFGLGTAIYLSEYARPRVRKLLKPLIELLAGIPTVIYGYFALKFISPFVQNLWPFGDSPGVFNALSAGLVMGIMILPMVASLSEDALSAVPHGLREGAYALGSSKFEVSTRVSVPAALSGIVAAFVLSVSRAVGETMIVLIAAGGTPNMSLNPGEAMQTMTAFIAAAGTGDLPQGSTGYKTIFAVGSLLFVATFMMNVFSNRIVRKYREVYE